MLVGRRKNTKSFSGRLKRATEDKTKTIHFIRTHLISFFSFARPKKFRFTLASKFPDATFLRSSVSGPGLPRRSDLVLQRSLSQAICRYLPDLRKSLLV